MSDEQWRSTLAINVDSLFGLVKHGVAQMKRQRSGGHVVLISSTAGQRGEAFHCDYAASKGAIISMVKGLSTELARDGIYVNCGLGWWKLIWRAPPSQTRIWHHSTGPGGGGEEIAASSHVHALQVIWRGYGLLTRAGALNGVAKLSNSDTFLHQESIGFHENSRSYLSVRGQLVWPAKPVCKARRLSPE
jgi:NAD(P)-dependent dehydrogenase (short-subunit alcohol dehydrogenase family)